jgi:hypothetical protein
MDGFCFGAGSLVNGNTRVASFPYSFSDLLAGRLVCHACF